MRTRHLTLCLGAAVALTVLSGCERTSDEVFKEDVAPVLERRCANGACHGSVEGQPDQQLDPARWLTFRISGAGRLTDVPAAMASAKAKVNSVEDPAFSSLLRKTLPLTAGGTYHFRSAVFQSTDDADFVVLQKWAASIKDGTEGRDQPPLTANEQLFSDKVYPFLIGRGCATSTCHGSLMFGGTVFQPPAVPGTLKLSKADLRATYREARRNITTWGDPVRSRLLAKILPFDKGGIPHKGGNDVFFAQELEAGKDPREHEGLRAWIAAERTAALGADGSSFVATPSLVVVGGPLPVAGPFDVQPFTPGSDLYRLDAPYTASPVNLTAAAHAAPADVRDPAVSHDGKTIAFSMRTSAEDAHNLYVIGVDGTGLKQLTNDKAAAANGLVVGNFAPVFGPNGGFNPATGTPPRERLYFSSTRAADLSDLASVQNADLYAVDVDGQNLERLTYTVVPEVRPWFLAAGEFEGAMAYTIKRSAEGGYKGVFFRFPVDHNAEFHVQPEAHPHFGMSEPPQVFYGLREAADGRALLTLMDDGNRWRGGQLAVLERQFAVEVPDGQEATATLPGFRHALTILTPDAARTGTSAGGLWRDPTPLPDGTFVVAHATGAIDLTSPDALVRTELVRVVLEENRTTNRPAIKSQTVLLSDATRAWSQPVAVYARGPEDPPHARKWDDTSATATLVHSGAQVIEAVLAQLSPTKARTVRDDIAYVRAVVPLQVAGALDSSPVPAEETRDGHRHATKLSLTGRMPLFAAVEIPPAADGSLMARIPAKVPVRVVTLDKDHLAVGTLQHQWYATLPGERFPVGIPLSSYNARCAGCHGAMDGNPNTVLAPPTDFITQASVTASAYREGDRRVPLDPPTVGAGMFVLVDFRKDVQPILNAKCATCHTGAAAPGGLTLTATPTAHYTDAYESLLAPGVGSAGGFKYVDADGYRARGSYLAERIMNREYDAPHVLTGPCPPAGSAPLTDAEKVTLVRWIEFGAAFVGTP